MSLFGKKKEETKSCCCSGNCDAKAMNTAEEKKSDAGIKVLGGGCAKCHELEANTKAALQALGLNETVELITDFSIISAYGVMTTPALVVDGKVVSCGKVLKATEIADKIKEARNGLKKVAFICVHNSCRSQIAEALGKHIAGDVFESYSAGTETKPRINQDAVRIMKELYGLDMEQTQYSKLIADIPSPDIAISMGCNVRCPFMGRPFDDNWGLEDPTGKPDEEFVKVIKEIEKKILELLINELFSSGYNCSQIVASFFAKKYGMNPEELKRIACGFAGGMRQGEVCGAVTGALMIVGMKYGNVEASDKKAKTECYEKTVEFEKAFIQKEGSVICKNLLECDISTDDGYKYAIEKNLFPTVCPKMILSAIMILKEQGY